MEEAENRFLISLPALSLLTRAGRPFAVGKLARVLLLWFPRLNPHVMKSQCVLHFPK